MFLINCNYSEVAAQALRCPTFKSLSAQLEQKLLFTPADSLRSLTIRRKQARGKAKMNVMS